MVRLRASRHLSCFYCGKRSGIRFDGTIRQFDCPYCEATNHLDENGDITDPPAATQREPTPSVQYAAPRAASPSESIFCATCLKNQRLFTASLAQYLADDPAQHDSVELDRKYYRFRRGLEERYPQVCADCEGKVGEAIDRAKYTAKTDHLRRMMERSRGRKTASRNTTLDWVNRAGRSLWWGGLVLQMLWHIKAASFVVAAAQSERVMYDPDGSSVNEQAAAVIARAGAVLPPADDLMNVSVVFAIASVWWNPQFVSVSRGFTKHLVGLRQWYSFQGLIVLVRFACCSLINMTQTKEHPKSAQLSAHLAIASFVSLICFMARRSIKVDTTPLFGTHSGSVTPLHQESPWRHKKEEVMTFSEELNDALSSPSLEPTQSWQSPPSSVPTPYRSLQAGQNTLHPVDDFVSAANLRISDPVPNPKVERVANNDEMDWSPTQPQRSTHRAFQESPTTLGNQPRAFNQVPADPNAGAFWYKVPPAPANPARKLRNPTMQPTLRRPVKKENPFFSQNTKEREAAEITQQEEKPRKRIVEFQDQRFFNGFEQSDTGLSEMFSSSFTLREDEEKAKTISSQSSFTGFPFTASREASAKVSRPATVGRPLAVNKLAEVKPGEVTPAAEAARRHSCQMEAMGLLASLVLWLLTLVIPVAFTVDIQLGLLVIGGVVALAASGREQVQRLPAVLSLLDSALSVAELAGVAWVGWETWTGNDEVGMYGVGAFGIMLLHRVGHLCI